jgi:hypothetical protein
VPELTIEKLQLFLLVVLPGLVAIRVYDLFCPTDKRDFTTFITDAAMFSLIHLAVWSPLLVPLNQGDWARGHFALYSLISLMVLVVSPAIVSIGFYVLRVKFLFRWIAHPTPTGWDYFFSNKYPCFLLFHLKNGKKVGGYLSSNSFVSQYPRPPEVYVENVWQVDEDGRFVAKIDGSLGMIVRFADCDLIEFFKAEDVNV